MGKTIRIRKGLNINIKGQAKEQVTETTLPTKFAIKPEDFPGLIPKLVAKEGDSVKVGSTLFFDKTREEIKFTSPVSGKVSAIVRGAKRKVLAIEVESDGASSAVSFDTSKDVKELLLESGMWTFIKQRPLDRIANPAVTPKAIFITGFNSAPLAPNYEFLLKGKEKEIQKGIEALKTLTKGKVHVTVEHANGSAGVFSKISGVELHRISGKHPKGNVGTQIHHIDPINKGETVYTLNALDVARIGEFLLTGTVNFDRVIPVTGSEVSEAKYVKTRIGAQMSSIVGGNIASDHVRIISGNVLTGKTVTENDYLGYYSDQVTVIPEGDHHKFFLTDGWLALGLNKLSANPVFPSALFKNKKFDVDTNTNGEERAFVMSGHYEKVFPFDIYPVQLLKAIITNDIDGMENLGIYEVAPEDFALCEFICVSKINSQQIVREGLEVVEKECM